MKAYISKSLYSYGLGFHATNYGYPIENEWEIGIHFFKWNFELELHNHTKEIK